MISAGFVSAFTDGTERISNWPVLVSSMACRLPIPNFSSARPTDGDAPSPVRQ
jgi:hypothetical protein